MMLKKQILHLQGRFINNNVYLIAVDLYIFLAILNLELADSTLLEIVLLNTSASFSCACCKECLFGCIYMNKKNTVCTVFFLFLWCWLYW